MVKPTKATDELAELIAAELIATGVSLQGVELTTHHDPKGWYVTVSGSPPEHVARVQSAVTVIADWLKSL
jgi:hypothetical protein